jgi:LacI family transcriptional regulator, galactose operon repressor
VATIRDVAQRAGVSIPTVSRVLNDRPNVADELAERVRSAIAELNYRPSRAAQRLRAQASRLVGVIFSDISNPFYINVLKGIEFVLSKDGFSLLISNADADPDREARMVQVMRAEGVAGLIIAPTKESAPEVKKAIDDGLPVVVFDRRMRDMEVDTVMADGLSGAIRAVNHLVALGHRRIGIISGPLHLSSARDRYAGYLQALSDADIKVEANLTRLGDYKMESGYQLATELISSRRPPTALFVANNEMTIGALNAIHDARRRMPDDIAIVGFDDFDWAVSLNPPLTTVAQSTFDIGVQAASLLLSRIGNPGRPGRTVVLETSLIVRASCGAELRQRRKAKPPAKVTT